MRAFSTIARGAAYPKPKTFYFIKKNDKFRLTRREQLRNVLLLYIVYIEKKHYTYIALLYTNILYTYVYI